MGFGSVGEGRERGRVSRRTGRRRAARVEGDFDEGARSRRGWSESGGRGEIREEYVVAVSAPRDHSLASLYPEEKAVPCERSGAGEKRNGGKEKKREGHIDTSSGRRGRRTSKSAVYRDCVCRLVRRWDEFARRGAAFHSESRARGG